MSSRDNLNSSLIMEEERFKEVHHKIREILLKIAIIHRRTMKEIFHLMIISEVLSLEEKLSIHLKI